MTELYLARHPESIYNVPPLVVGGRTNWIPLTELGQAQALQFAHAFHESYPAPTALYSSPAVRTLALMDAYRTVSGEALEFTIDDQLQEMSHGPYEGKVPTDVYTEEVLELIKAQQFDYKHPGGESLNDVRDRMLEWVWGIHKAHPDGTVLATTHGQSIRTIVGSLLGWTHFQTTRDPEKKAGNVSLTSLTVDDDAITVNFYAKDIISARTDESAV